MLLGAGLTTRNKDATRSKGHRYSCLVTSASRMEKNWFHQSVGNRTVAKPISSSIKGLPNIFIRCPSRCYQPLGDPSEARCWDPTTGL